MRSHGKWAEKPHVLPAPSRPQAAALSCPAWPLASLSFISMTSVSARAKLHGWSRSHTPQAGFQRKSSKGIPAIIQTTA